MRTIHTLNVYPELLLLDMDDTLFDTEGINQKLFKEYFGNKGKILSSEQIQYIIGASILDIFKELSPEEPIAEMERFLSFKETVLPSLMIRKATGLEQLLDIPIPKVIVSGSSMREIKGILKTTNISIDHFASIYPIESYQKGKPNSAGYRKALRDFEIKPHKALVIEDSHAGIISANRANIPAIHVTEFSKANKQTTAQYVAGTLADIAYAIQQVEK